MLLEPTSPYAGGMDVEGVRLRLLEERADAVGRLRDLGASFDDIVAAAQDSNLDDEHDPEGTTIAAERSLVSSLVQSNERHLAAIDAALARLKDGTYGQCLSCGGAISPERLDARASTAVCIDCAAAAR